MPSSAPQQAPPQANSDPFVGFPKAAIYAIQNAWDSGAPWIGTPDSVVARLQKLRASGVKMPPLTQDHADFWMAHQKATYSPEQPQGADQGSGALDPRDFAAQSGQGHATPALLNPTGLPDVADLQTQAQRQGIPYAPPQSPPTPHSAAPQPQTWGQFLAGQAQYAGQATANTLNPFHRPQPGEPSLGQIALDQIISPTIGMAESAAAGTGSVMTPGGQLSLQTPQQRHALAQQGQAIAGLVGRAAQNPVQTLKNPQDALNLAMLLGLVGGAGHAIGVPIPGLPTEDIAALRDQVTDRIGATVQNSRVLREVAPAVAQARQNYARYGSVEGPQALPAEGMKAPTPPPASAEGVTDPEAMVSRAELLEQKAAQAAPGKQNTLLEQAQQLRARAAAARTAPPATEPATAPAEPASKPVEPATQPTTQPGEQGPPNYQPGHRVEVKDPQSGDWQPATVRKVQKNGQVLAVPDNGGPVVKANGAFIRPLTEPAAPAVPDTLFHGTNATFGQFDLAHAGANKDAGLFGKGIYLTDQEQTAQKYGSNVLPVTPALKNPYVWPSDAGNVRTVANQTPFGKAKSAELPADIRPDVMTEYKKLVPSSYVGTDGRLDESTLSQAVTNVLQRKGYDGVIYDNPYAKGKQSEYGLFNPEQAQVHPIPTEPPAVAPGSTQTHPAAENGSIPVPPAAPQEAAPSPAAQVPANAPVVPEHSAPPEPFHLPEAQPQTHPMIGMPVEFPAEGQFEPRTGKVVGVTPDHYLVDVGHPTGAVDFEGKPLPQIVRVPLDEVVVPPREEEFPGGGYLNLQQVNDGTFQLEYTPDEHTRMEILHYPNAADALAHYEALKAEYAARSAPATPEPAPSQGFYDRQQHQKQSLTPKEQKEVHRAVAQSQGKQLTAQERARAEKLRQAIREGEMRLRSQVNAIGKRLSGAELQAIRRSVDTAQANLDALEGKEKPTEKPVSTPAAEEKPAPQPAGRTTPPQGTAEQRAEPKQGVSKEKIIARTEPKQSVQHDGTFHIEYRFNALTEADKKALIDRGVAVNPKSVAVQTRRVDERPGEAPTYGEWRTYEGGSTPEKALENAWDSGLQKATALDPRVKKAQERYAFEQQINAEIADLKKEGAKVETQINDIARRYNREVVPAALKKAKLWKAYQEGTAPNEKLQQIKEQLTPQFNAEKQALQAEHDRIKAEIAAKEKALKVGPKKPEAAPKAPSTRPNQGGYVRLGRGGSGPAGNMSPGEAGRNLFGVTTAQESAQTARHALREATTAFKTYFAPRTLDEIGRAAVDTLTAEAAQTARDNRVAVTQIGTLADRYARIAAAAQAGDTTARDQLLDFWHRMETGQAQANPEDQAIATALRHALDAETAKIQAETGRLKQPIVNYLPHRVAMGGPSPGGVPGGKGGTFVKNPAFMKERKYATVQDLYDNGFELEDLNPVSAVTKALIQMQKFRLAYRVKQQFAKQGMLRFFRRPEQAQALGWQPIQTNFFKTYSPAFALDREGNPVPTGYVKRGEWYAPPAAAAVLNNYLAPYQADRGMAPLTEWLLRQKYGMLKVILGLNAFHAQTTAFHDVVVSATTAAMDAGDRHLAESLKGLGHATLGLSTLGTTTTARHVQIGRAMRAEYDNPGSQPPQIQAAVNALVQAGGSPHPAAVYGIGDALKRSMGEFNRLNLLGAAHAATGAMDALSMPLFNALIPNVKAGVFYDLVNRAQDRLIAQYGSLNDVPDAVKRQQYHDLWTHVEDIFGQVDYNRLLMHPAAKNAMFLTLSTPGWKLGTYKLAGGALNDVRQLIFGDRTTAGGRRRMPFALIFLGALAGAVVARNYLVHLAMTGDPHVDTEDLLLPRTGALDANGDPERILMPGYNGEYTKAVENPAGVLTGAISPELRTGYELATNRDYQGNQIHGEGGEGLKAYLTRQLMPISIRSNQQIAQNQALSRQPGGTIARALTLLGASPAPASLTRSRAEKTALDLLMSHSDKGARPYWKALLGQLRRTVKQGVRAGQTVPVADLLGQMMAQGLIGADTAKALMTGGTQAPLVGMFSGLREIPDALQVLEQATPEEAAELQPYAFLKFATPKGAATAAGTRFLMQLAPDEQQRLMNDLQALGNAKTAPDAQRDLAALRQVAAAHRNEKLQTLRTNNALMPLK